MCDVSLGGDVPHLCGVQSIPKEHSESCNDMCFVREVPVSYLFVVSMTHGRVADGR